MFELGGSVAVVTGASSGLGRRFALDMAARGATVVGVARRAELLHTLGEELRRRTKESATVDLRRERHRQFREGPARHRQRAGPHRRARQQCRHRPTLRDSDPDLGDYRVVMDTNYFAAVAGTLTVLPGMLQRRRGVVVNVSSDSGRAPSPHEAAYSASKAALSAFTEALSFDTEGTGVHLHVLYPGWVPTAMGSAAVDAGMPMPPRMVRRTEEQVSQLLVAHRRGAGGHRRGPDRQARPDRAGGVPRRLPQGRAPGRGLSKGRPERERLHPSRSRRMATLAWGS